MLRGRKWVSLFTCAVMTLVMLLQPLPGRFAFAEPAESQGITGIEEPAALGESSDLQDADPEAHQEADPSLSGENVMHALPHLGIRIPSSMPSSPSRLNRDVGIDIVDKI